MHKSAVIQLTCYNTDFSNPVTASPNVFTSKLYPLGEAETLAEDIADGVENSTDAEFVMIKLETVDGVYFFRSHEIKSVHLRYIRE